ncbi:MAG: DUF2971 domain-containing protein [Gammaproteobacteria bacterium]|nr:DUF2971 domain-containing protein [Gammaproteobacteria bacterium]
MAQDLDSNSPKVLYKYLPAERALQALPEKGGDGALRATQPGAMNDPLECATQYKAEYSSEIDEASEIVSVLNKMVPTNPYRIEDVQSMREQLGTQAWNELFREQLSQRLGIVSFSSNYLHPLLWSHYGDSGTGVVIGYKLDELEKIASGHQQLHSVIYFDNPPPIKDLEIFKTERNLHRILLTKSKHWEYEQEWRLTLELTNTVGIGEDDRTGHSINLCKIPNEAVSEVYFTERISKDHLEQLKLRLRDPINRFGAISPQKLILKPDNYGYEKQLLRMLAAALSGQNFTKK